MTTWQPIETAPKDGRVIIAWFGAARDNYVESVYWSSPNSNRGAWTWQHDGDQPENPPTHWMLLPAPPTGDA